MNVSAKKKKLGFVFMKVKLPLNTVLAFQRDLSKSKGGNGN